MASNSRGAPSIFIAPIRPRPPSALVRAVDALEPRPTVEARRPTAEVRPFQIRDGNAGTSVDASIDGRLIAIIDEPLETGESAMTAFARKEAALGTVMARLSILEARRLHMRLAANRPNDDLAARFARLTAERRTRLLNFLADARRRNALAAARR